MASSSSKIQGIIIEIGGDTSKLKQSLKEVDTELNTTSSRLKDVEKLLKLDPSNIKLLQQQSEYLNKSIEDTKDKLQLLNDILEQANAKGVEEDSESYKQLEREIITTTQSLESLYEKQESVTSQFDIFSTSMGKLTSEIENFNSKIESTNTKLTEVDELLKLDPSNVELLDQKWGYLTEQIEETSSKLEKLKDIQSTMTEQGIDKESEDYKALNRQIEATNIQLSNLVTQKQEVADKTEDVTGKTKSLTDEEKKVAAATKEHEESQKSLSSKLNETALNIQSYIAIAKEVIATLKKVVDTVVGIATAAGESAKEIEKLSKQTKLSTDEIQELSYVAENCGVSLDVITKTVKQNILAIKEASQYNGDYMEAYDKLGISIYDTNGALKDSGDVYWEVIEALSEMEESTERDIIAEQLLGRKASDLNNIFALSQEEFAALTEEAHNIGYVLTEETLTSLSALGSELISTNKSWEATKNLLAKTLSPAISSISTELNGLLELVNQMLNDGVDLEVFFESLSTKLGEGLANLLNDLIDDLPTILKTVFLSVGGIVEALATMLSELDWYNLVFELITSISDIALNLLPDLFANIMTSASNLLFNLIGDLFTGEFWVRIGKMGANIGISLVNGLIGAVENGINAVIQGLEKLLKVFNIDLKEISIPKIPMLAKGGILSSGSAIVGEAGPELLTNVNGKSIVQPLTKNQALTTATSGTQQVISINFTGSLSQLAKVLQPEIKQETIRKGVSLLDY